MSLGGTAQDREEEEGEGDDASERGGEHLTDNIFSSILRILGPTVVRL